MIRIIYTLFSNIVLGHLDRLARRSFGSSSNSNSTISSSLVIDNSNIRNSNSSSSSSCCCCCCCCCLWFTPSSDILIGSLARAVRRETLVCSMTDYGLLCLHVLLVSVCI